MYKVELSLAKNHKIHIKSNHPDYLKTMIGEFSVHAQNYYFSPKYRSGIWNGKINFISNNGLIAYGLLSDFMNVHRKLFPDLKIIAEKEVKEIYKGEKLEIKYDLKYKPRFYQQEAVEACLKYTKGIIVSSTASGKSLSIAYILKILLDNKKIKNGLIVVPNKNLVRQFKNDLIDYGMNENSIGQVYGESKEWNKTIVISTWQTLMNNHKMLELFDIIIGDETHKNKALELKKIFSKAKMKYKFGFTGTMPTHLTDIYNVKSFIGPVLKEYKSGLLAEKEFISRCNVKVIEMDYNDIISSSYNGIKDEIFNKEKRLKLIEKIIKNVDDNILLLVSQISEGKKLEKLVHRKCKNKIGVFLSGKDNIDLREEWRQKIIKSKNIAVIATFQIYQEGVNIPNLKYLIPVSSTKSKIRIIQSIGRVLRLFKNKKDGGVVFDIHDNVKYLKSHGNNRIKYYEEEGFNIEYFKEKEFVI